MISQWFSPQIIFATIPFYISPPAQGRMSHWKFTTSFSPIPQSSPVPDDKQAVRGHPATRLLSKHLPVLCGSDLITVPGSCCALPSQSLPASVDRDLAPAAIEDYSPPTHPSVAYFILTSEMCWEEQFYELGGLWALSTHFFLSFCRTNVSADSVLSSFPSDALQGSVKMCPSLASAQLLCP